MGGSPAETQRVGIPFPWGAATDALDATVDERAQTWAGTPPPAVPELAG